MQRVHEIVARRVDSRAMAAKKSPVRSDPAATVRAVLRDFERLGSARIRGEMASRYGITAPDAFGIRVAKLHEIGKRLGRDHDLADALWQSGVYEARMLACFVDEPARVTPRQMDRWCADFDNWAICDTACFHLFDRTPYVLTKVAAWAKRRAEFEKRAAFALLAGAASHADGIADDAFAKCLPLAERAAADPRNFVKKGVSWALRSVGQRSRPLHAASLAVADRLIASEDPAARWVGKDVRRDLDRPLVRRRLDR